jgi:cyclopropane-fatty-acyl-phospholipid synthase
MDRHSAEVKKLFAEVYGANQAQKWVQRWRIFFMACAELFGYDDGQEWFVSHYLFARVQQG